jgi:hypothetical protein
MLLLLLLVSQMALLLLLLVLPLPLLVLSHHLVLPQLAQAVNARLRLTLWAGG